MEWFLIILLFIINIYLIIKSNKKQEINNNIIKENKELENKNIILKNDIANKKETLNSLQQSIDGFQNVAKESFIKYCDALDESYGRQEIEYDELIDKLNIAYNMAQDKLIQNKKQEQNELEKIRATRIAAQEALIKEKEIKEDLSFYCVIPTEEELDDIAALERIKPKLHQPRILCMLIWSTYFQKPMTALCNQVLGVNEITGIYKITNQETNQCYIGQAVDVAKRWKDHAKCGLGIDTPANNKLYKAIAEYGLQHFSFELLEKCPKDQLDEKEKYYIDLYQSYEYGYNSTKGNK